MASGIVGNAASADLLKHDRAPHDQRIFADRAFDERRVIAFAATNRCEAFGRVQRDGCRVGDAHFEEVRVGFRPKTNDELPYIGRSETMPRVFYALGHYRNGVLLAPLTAVLVADLVLDTKERAELALVRPGRLANA